MVKVEPRQLLAARLARARGFGQAQRSRARAPRRSRPARRGSPATISPFGLRRHAQVDRAVAGDDLRLVVVGRIDHRAVGERRATSR